ncbi:MAG: GLUG motif-containing protein, partial [Candidatus Nanoarchaeia archaeon]|nr:GLUG motif-containing protein [Candidatus Nanoarchaeia archaeon]
MKKGVSKLLFFGILNLIFLMSWVIAFSGLGSGTSASPYQIINCTALSEITNSLTSYYILMNDIDCSGIANFDPIGSCSSLFAGNFDGQGHKITNFKVDTASSCAGLFANTSSTARIKNLFIDANVKGATHVGGLVGYNSGSIENCQVISRGSNFWIKGNAFVGGLVGSNEGYIDGCSVNANVTCTYTGAGLNNFEGGLIGFNSGIVRSSSAKGVVNWSGTGSYCQHVGGLIGLMSEAGLAENCYSTAKVNLTGTVAGNYVGGLIGYNNGTLRNSYASGNVSGYGKVGGLIGYLGYDNAVVFISNCFATGNVLKHASGTGLGGLAGEKHSSAS